MAKPRISKTFGSGTRVSAESLGAVAESQQADRLAAQGGGVRDRAGRDVGPLQGKGASSWRYREFN